jgi:hypothetical protein
MPHEDIIHSDQEYSFENGYGTAAQPKTLKLIAAG